MAGGQNGNERRRRRLAQEESNAESPSVDDIGTLLSAPPVICHIDTETLLRRFVSPRLWKHVVLLTGVFAILLSGLWWQHHLMRCSAEQQVAAVGMALNGAVGMLLLLAAELAIITGWVRARSVIDFQGGFRWWKWWGACLLLLSAAMLTNVSSVLPELLATLIEPVTGSIRAARPALQVMVLSVFSIIVLGRILPDMSRCLWSQTFLVAAILTVVLRLMLTRSVAMATVPPSVLSALEVTAAFFTFASMLLHCRFVSYVSNAPPTIVARFAEAGQTLTKRSKSA